MFKVRFGKEMRMFQNAANIQTYEQLMRLVKSKFSNCPSSFAFTYEDQEGDRIQLENTSDLEIFVAQVCEKRPTKPMFKLELLPNEEEELLESEPSIAKISQRSHEIANDYQIQILDIDQPSSESQEIYQVCTSDFQELIEDLSNQDSQFLDSEEQDTYFNELVRKNLKEIQQKIIENAVIEAENRIVSQQVQGFIDQTYQNISQMISQQLCEQRKANEEKSTQDIQEGDDSQQEVIQMIERALHKQLPTFIDQLTRRTIIEVKHMLQLSDKSHTIYQRKHEIKLLV